MVFRTAGTKSRSQVTENLIKKLDTPLGFLYAYLFVLFPITPQSGICLPSTMLSGFVLRVKHNVAKDTNCIGT